MGGHDLAAYSAPETGHKSSVEQRKVLMTPVNRRRLALSSAASGIAALVAVRQAVARDDNDEGQVMRRFIDEVLNEGNVDNLDAIIHPDVEMPDLDLTGIEAFREASISADEGRRSRFDAFSFDVEAILAEDVDAVSWAVAVARFIGSTRDGVNFDVPAFYAAQLEDGVIRTLYGTIDTALYVEQTR